MDLRPAAVALATMLVVAGCASARTTSDAPRRTPATSVSITYWPHGQGSGVRRWRLRCGPPAGTHPRPRAACAELGAHPNAFAPVRRPCPFMIRRGSPQAFVTGHVGAGRVERLLRPVCDAAAWSSLHTLLTGR
jgi:hypothetical protein